ncbi:MAG: hypothetical protein HYV40_00110 [Candidatus Levybacteria bacterium]|nr:hypothetical protein [Candidatus Levybacteria bacterium]
MPTKTLTLIGGLIVLTIVLLFVATRQGTKQPTPPQPQPSLAPAASPTPTPPAYTTLQLSPNPVSIEAGGKGTVQVLIDTHENTITGVQLELSYDPKALTNVVITPGAFFQNPLIIPQWNKVDQATGRISHAQVLTPAQAGVQGKGIVATITFTRATGTPSAQTTLEFLPKTAVTQSGISPSVLKSMSNTTINL